MEVLGRIRWLANLEVVAGRQLQKSFDARARMLRPLAFVAVRQQKYQAGEQVPFVFTRADELINYCLRHIREISELRFPQYQRLGIVSAVAVLKPEHACL